MKWKMIAASTAAGVLAAASAFAAAEDSAAGADPSAQRPAAGAGPSAQGPAQEQNIASADNLDESTVRQLQQSLNQEGFDAGPVDGIFGPMTQGALESFQEARGIEPTGDLNQDTVVALGFEPAEFAAAEVGQPALDESDIREVQQRLNEEGFSAGPVDGIMGPNTRDALRAFQEAGGIEPSGELNRETVVGLGLPVSEFAAGEFADSEDQ